MVLVQRWVSARFVPSEELVMALSFTTAVVDRYWDNMIVVFVSDITRDVTHSQGHFAVI